MNVHSERARGPRMTRLVVVSLCALALICACGRQVSVTPPESPAPACAGLALPEAVAGGALRPTGADGTAAWGEPPITWRCGVPRPAALQPTSQLLEVGGVAWLPIEGSGGSAFIAVNWPTQSDPVYVEVIVPDSYDNPGSVLLDLSPALATQA